MSLRERLRESRPTVTATAASSPTPTPVVEARPESKATANPSRNTPQQIRKAIMQMHHTLLGNKQLGLTTASKKASMELKEFEKTAGPIISEQLRQNGTLLTKEEQLAVIRGVHAELFGLGPLDELLADPDITEIMVNSPTEIFIERKGKLTLSGVVFFDEAHVRRIIDGIVARIGRRIDENSPLVDARLADGSRFNAVIPPLSLKGSTVTIRKFSKTPFVIEDLIRFGSIPVTAATFLKACVRGKLNILISGGTGSGKTTLLNVLSGYIPEGERIVTAEDAAELKLNQSHVIGLETRPASVGSMGAITIRSLIKNALRMRPDRIVVGECRGGEALDMLQAMNTGHAGSMTTGHANTPRDMLKRLETMVLMSGMELPVRAIREQVVSAVSLIVQQSRFHDGTRKVSHITEILDMDEDGQIKTVDIFRFKQTGMSPEGKILGALLPTGAVPTFLEQLNHHDIHIAPSFFNEVGKVEDIRFESAEPSPARSEVTPKGHKLREASLTLLEALIESAQGQGSENDVSLEKMPAKQLLRKMEICLEQLQASNRLPALLPKEDKACILQWAQQEMRGLGPLEPLLENDEINEIFVNGPKTILVRKNGQLMGTDVCFVGDKHMRRVIASIVAPLGRRCDDSSPMVDARLPDGSGFNAILPPLSLIGPVITVRKFSKFPFTAQRFIDNGTWDAQVSDFMTKAIQGKLNLVVFGGTGTGKTTLLNVLSNDIPDHERIITMENTAELRLQQTHVVCLETRGANSEGSGTVSMQDLVRNALRMRPERIIIGEITGAEALDMLQAMNTGHDGSMCTGHANTPEDMISRIETLVLMSGYDLPIKAIREQIASAVDILVHVITLPSGAKRIASVTEVGEVDTQSQKIILQTLYEYVPERRGTVPRAPTDTHTAEHFRCTGLVPTFLEKLRLNGVMIDESYFKEIQP